MNRINTQYIQDPNIRLPFTQPILDHIQVANKVQGWMLANAISSDDVIDLGYPIALYDCYNYGSGINPGVVLFGNEVWQFNGYAGPFTGSSQVMKYDLTYLANDTYTDGIARPTREFRYLKLIDSNVASTGGTEFNFADLVYLQYPKTQMTMLNSFSSTAYARKDLGKKVSFDGTAFRTTQANNTMFTLPVGMRPTSTKQVLVGTLYSTSGFFAETLTIATNGNVSVTANSGTGNMTVYLDGVSFNII